MKTVLSREAIKKFISTYTGREREITGSFSQNANTDYFNIFNRETSSCSHTLPNGRRNFYKISLIQEGTGQLLYADKTYKIKDNCIVFSNPNIPYAWEAKSVKQTGHFCIFDDRFLDTHFRGTLKFSPLFGVNGYPVLPLDPAEVKFFALIFEKMNIEWHSDYSMKNDLIRNYLGLILHKALKLNPAKPSAPLNSAGRITSLFLQLLESQFPILHENHKLQLRTPQQFADQLAIHVNHLNKSVKEITGKTTTEQIALRIELEAKILLHDANLSINQVADWLAFEYASHFNNFFKKRTGLSPKSFRHSIELYN